MLKRLFLFIAINLSLQHNPVYNVIEDDPLKNPNNPMVPQITTNYEQMVTDRSKRIITIGEPKKDLQRSIEFSPVHHYDEEVEFVQSQKNENKKYDYQPLNDKEINSKETQIEQMIYSLYELKNQDERDDFLIGETSAINQFLIITGSANQGLSLNEIHIIDKIRELIVFLRQKEVILKTQMNQQALMDCQQKVKNLSFLLDQKDWQKKIVDSLDTDIFTYNRTMQQLDAPLKYYADRVSFLVKKGEVYDLAAFADIANFGYFAQRKSKLQMIYRKMSIVRAKNMTGDLQGQQNAIINLIDELLNELHVCEGDLKSLSLLQNQMSIIAPLENVKKINLVMENCVNQMIKFPEVQFICKDILKTHDFSTVNTFKKLSFMIKQEVAEYEHSISSLITQIQLGRAAQDAINLRYVSNVYQSLSRMTTECQNNQKKITANQKIAGLISNINSFRQSDFTVALSLQNIDNILFETNKGQFWNMNDAQQKEFIDGSDHFSKKQNTQRMLIDKLVEAAGKVAIETTPENSHQAEEMLENLVLFMQRQDKLVQLTKNLAKKDYATIKTIFLQEIDQLTNRQQDFLSIITRLTALEVKLYQIDIKSGQNICQSIMDEKYLKAMPKMRLAQAYGQLVINERRMAAGYLQMAHKELDMNLQQMIASEQDIYNQIVILEQIQEQSKLELGENLLQITEVTQDMVITDPKLEQLLNSIRELLKSAKGIEAKDKILLFVNQDQNEHHENEFQAQDIQSLTHQTKEDIEGDDYQMANRHSEQLVQMIQQGEKNSDILYTLKAALFFGKQNLKSEVQKVVQDLKTSIQKEFFSINNKQKQIQKIDDQIKQLVDKNLTNVQLNQQLLDIKQKSFLNSKYYDMINLAIQLSTENDQNQAKQTLKDINERLNKDVLDLQLSNKIVDQQQQIMDDGIQHKDYMEIFHLLEEVQKLNQQQIIVATDDELNQIHNDFIGFRNQKNHLKSLDSLQQIKNKGIQYLTFSEQHVIDLHDLNQIPLVQKQQVRNEQKNDEEKQNTKKTRKNKKKQLRK